MMAVAEREAEKAHPMDGSFPRVVGGPRPVRLDRTAHLVKEDARRTRPPPLTATAIRGAA